MIGLGIVISIADSLSLVAILWIIHFYIEPGSSSGAAYLPAWLADKESIALIAAFFVAFSVKNIIAYLVARAHYNFTGEVAVRISRNNLVSYLRSPFVDFVNTDSSAFIRKIALQPFEFAQHVLSGIQQIITQVFLIVIAIVAIVIFNVKIFLLLLAILLPPVVLVFYFIKKRLTTVKKNLRDSNERSYQYLLDALKGYVEANIYQRSTFFLNRFIEHRRIFSKHLFGSLSLQNLPGRVIEIFAVMGLFILILIAQSSGTSDNSTLITVGAFMAAAYKIIPGLVKLINLSGQLKAYEFSATELENAREMNDESADSLSEPLESMEFKNINFAYADSPVINNLTFNLTKGDFLGISGVSGKGKTTLLNLLLGFLSPGSGAISINGKQADISRIKQYWPSVAYVRQQSFFIYDTILRNITLEENNPDQQRLEMVLQITGLDKLIKQFPEGLNKVITENGKNISGGQQQRIAVARALYKKASLLLLDEPFNELDEASTEAMLRQIKELSQDRIIILITHDSKSLNYCNKILSLDEQG